MAERDKALPVADREERRGNSRRMQKGESLLSPFCILLLYFLTAGAVKKWACGGCQSIVNGACPRGLYRIRNARSTACLKLDPAAPMALPARAPSVRNTAGGFRPTAQPLVSRMAAACGQTALQTPLPVRLLRCIAPRLPFLFVFSGSLNRPASESRVTSTGTGYYGALAAGRGTSRLRKRIRRRGD